MGIHSLNAEQRERAEKIKKSTWHVTDAKGREFDFTFGQMCTYFGIKYKALYKRVVIDGRNFDEALNECRNDPHCWGLTYSNGTLACGVWDNNPRWGKTRTIEERSNPDIFSQL